MQSHNPVPDITVDTTYGVCAAAGFRAAGVEAGFKASGGKDLALVVNDGPEFDAAAVFTSNRVAAAPVHWSREVIRQGTSRAVILNSGGANACTGTRGFQNTHETAELVADRLDVGAGDVLVCSTGLIGEQLPMDVMRAGIPALTDALAAGPEAGQAAAEAIMTTDSVSKQACAARDGWTVGGIAKGAGMLAPGLATMLVVITTDAKLPSEVLGRALREACRVTFNRTDSDGCMSTNDTVTLMSSGASGTTADEVEFTRALTAVCHSLAQQLITDAEGASHDIAITTVGAATETEAEDVSRAVSRSALLKTAVFGNDPNWGRVLSAVGTTSAQFDPDRIDVTINGVMVCRNGAIGDSRDTVDMAAARAVDIVIDLKAGNHQATVWSNDLTHDYVEENSAYSS
ncbi:bifunctional glutamate N-acetyltransferase/amino-acid acetyltransferase ArgJ [Kocuria sp. cx-116]|uniref:bifunctional glutamate N-acetyltransferase/amino-acid acetyltransferase ArgJ n=1 Tax=Kocuria sp. cx-116 TaxID=2771378 RepID=UPI0016858D5D|nr:bifunctional glutamate N-acetyltransferase/amino-acid acetyltransferase ArgJ [Kocuria sp. cx-116]MBD2762577.1 bifunctional glutamate N-acetyltransferase/amino-acid acetyltransferase ArgJ [Kocuria sp. cx-116]